MGRELPPVEVTIKSAAIAASAISAISAIGRKRLADPRRAVRATGATGALNAAAGRICAASGRADPPGAVSAAPGLAPEEVTSGLVAGAAM
jgi:hypothetical protein